MSDYAPDPARTRLILENARTLYEKYGRVPEPFNVFTVLRSRSDEVNLHSRFLHALLDHQEPGREQDRRNLKDFLETVVKVADFDIPNAKVEREKDNIDLLITNTNPSRAVVIENKIWAGDQPEQLKKYYHRVSGIPGIDKANIHIFYLTLDGREASKDSAGGIKYTRVSYEDILPWLEACQRRAVNNPPLRESLAQYIDVVRGLTGLNIDAKYMEELKALCLEKDNFVLVSHLSKAHEEACVHLVVEMWKEIKKAMEIEFEGTGILETGPDPRSSCVSENGDGDVAETKIKDAIIHGRGNNIRSHGLYYPLSPDKDNPTTAPSLGVELDSGALWYGIRCRRKDFKEEFDAIKKNLSDESGYDKISQWGWWPWGRDAFGKLGIDYLRIGKGPEQWLRLKNEDHVKKCAKEIAEELKKIREVLQAVRDAKATYSKAINAEETP